MRSYTRSDVFLNVRLQAVGSELATDAVGDWLRQRATVLVPHYRGSVVHGDGVLAASFGALTEIRARRAVRAGWAIRFAANAGDVRVAVAILLEAYQDARPMRENGLVVASPVAERLRGIVRLRKSGEAGLPDADFRVVEGFANRGEQQLAELRGLYDIKVDARLRPLLHRSPQWYSVLVDTHAALRREFGWKVRLVIESQSDYQRASSTLVLRIIAWREPKDWASRFEAFTRNWWLDVPRPIRERLQLDLRLVQS